MDSTAKPGESELIHRFRRGDEEAFRILLEGCEGQLHTHIARHWPHALRRRLSVADVLQDARLAAFEHRHKLEDRGPGSFRRWMLGILDWKARHVVDWHAGVGKRALGREITRSGRPDTAQFLGREPSPSQAAVGNELATLASEAIGSLPAHHREVLRLVRLEQMTLREVAERTGRSREATKKLYGRALRAFTDTLNRLRGESHA